MKEPQYLVDEKGKKTAVLLPILEFEAMQREIAYGIPEWHKELVLSREKEQANDELMGWKEVRLNLKRKK
jgi:hypothetical protein